MANGKTLNSESYVRELSYSQKKQLAFLLDPCDMWKNFAARIPEDYGQLFEENRSSYDSRYLYGNILSFERNHSPTMAVLDDWGSENCQIKHLIKLLWDSELFAAAKEVADFIDQSVPAPPAHETPAAAASFAVDGGGAEHAVSLSSSVRKKDCGASPIEIAAPAKPHPPHQDNTKDEEALDLAEDAIDICFEKLDKITGNFDEKDITKGGNLIGTGGFGDVFLGRFRSSSGKSAGTNKVAVKRLRNSDEESLKQFQTEVKCLEPAAKMGIVFAKTLCTYKHENLVILVGYSSDGPYPCLVYEYIENGSLQDRLACLNGTAPLSVPLRLDIAKGTATGIHFLHEKGVTHRDIKTANILLDLDFKPKVSDFATARTLPKAIDSKTREMLTDTIIGSTSYLAPEAYNFKIHPGMDVFSFGVVLLELLTGLPVMDSNRENADLKIHVQEYCTPYASDDDEDEEEEEKDDSHCQESGTIFDLVDKRPGVLWTPQVVEDLYKLSKQCLERSIKLRKKMKAVLEELKQINIDMEGIEVNL